MTKEEHQARHIELHKALDELVGDWISQTTALPSRNSVMALMKWSHQQTLDPDELKED